MKPGHRTEKAEKPETTPEDLEVRAWYASIGQSIVTVKIYRDNAEGVGAFLGEGSTDQVDEIFLQKQYGGGKFRLRPVGDNGHIYGSRSVLIEGQPKPDPATQNGDNNKGGGNADIYKLVILMMGQQQQATQQMNTALIGALGGRSDAPAPAPGPTIGELVEAVTGIKSLIEPAPADTNFDRMISILEKGVEMGQSGGEASWKEIIKEVAPLAKDAIAAAAGGGVELPAGTSEELLKRGIDKLKAYARKGSPPGFFADEILLKLDEAQYRVFLPYAQQPFANFVALDPELAKEPYNGWFLELHTGVADGLRNAVDSTGDTGDKSDAADHEQTR